jgi:hypothetical protein
VCGDQFLAVEKQNITVLDKFFRLDHRELRRAFMRAHLQHLDHMAYYEFLTELHQCLNSTTSATPPQQATTNTTTTTTLDWNARVAAVEREEEYFGRNPVGLDALLACIPDGGPQENHHWWLARRGVNQLPSPLPPPLLIISVWVWVWLFGFES